MPARRFDFAPLLEAVSGDETMFRELMKLFRTSTRADLDTIRAAIDRQDSRTVRATAHHLKGSLLEVAASAEAALALQLETMGAEQQLTNAEAVWQKLDAGIRELVAAMSQIAFPGRSA